MSLELRMVVSVEEGTAPETPERPSPDLSEKGL
jgi:hypothetical protein